MYNYLFYVLWNLSLTVVVTCNVSGLMVLLFNKFDLIWFERTRYEDRPTARRTTKRTTSHPQLWGEALHVGPTVWNHGYNSSQNGETKERYRSVPMSRPSSNLPVCSARSHSAAACRKAEIYDVFTDLMTTWCGVGILAAKLPRSEL